MCDLFYIAQKNNADLNFTLFSDFQLRTRQLDGFMKLVGLLIGLLQFSRGKHPRIHNRCASCNTKAGTFETSHSLDGITKHSRYTFVRESL